MKLLQLAALSLAAVACAAPAASAQRRQTPSAQRAQTSPPPKPALSAARLFEMGKLNGSTYTNEHFGIAFDAPKGWTILDLAVMRAMGESAKGIFRDEGNARVKRAMEESVDRTVPLFSATKLPPGTAGAFNASLVLAAEKIPTAIVKTPRDYYNLMLHSMKLSQGVDIEVVEPFRATRIGGSEFGVYTVKVTSNLGIMLQKQLLTVQSPYALGLVLTYGDEADARVFDEVMSSLKVR
jgi:hypothetical protein